ncbi:5'-AMP-activated protein kinase subunit gamma-2-like [Uloborus diversus]|uniref:5'-AMP-activated protein kinase subunit gamma-2-like n=1 Tax=Uloborus diversus TaxID=327109 RepID=UPI002409A5CF|nr:5'-AMP-activated protein kinase subunit gamma-2-like [Uloborus diversus]
MGKAGSPRLSQATKLLIQEEVHRLPVYEEKRHSVLFVITKKRLLQYLYNNLIEKFDKSNVKTPGFLKKTIGELKLGSWENIVKVTFKTRVIEALDLFIEKNVSALPVVDDDDKLIDLFAKFDVFALAKEKTYHNLELTISETIDKAEVHEGVYVCTVDETLETVIDKFVTVKVHRLVITDGKRTVLGIISLSDVLKFLVLQSAGECNLLAADIIEEGPEGAIGGIESDSVFYGSLADASSALKQSTSFEEEEPCDLSEDLVKLQVESQSACEAALESVEDENEQSDA